MHANRFYFKLSFVAVPVWQKLAEILCLLTRVLCSLKCGSVMTVLSLRLDALCLGLQITDPL